jgi:hypothetical protein
MGAQAGAAPTAPDVLSRRLAAALGGAVASGGVPGAPLTLLRLLLALLRRLLFASSTSALSRSTSAYGQWEVQQEVQSRLASPQSYSWQEAEALLRVLSTSRRQAQVSLHSSKLDEAERAHSSSTAPYCAPTPGCLAVGPSPGAGRHTRLPDRATPPPPWPWPAQVDR